MVGPRKDLANVEWIRTKGARWMVCATWPHATGDLASTRLGASAFLDDLASIYAATNQQNWVGQWTNIGNAHCLIGDLEIEKGASDKAVEGWLCALTAFEVARRLVNDDDAQRASVSIKVERVLEKIRSSEHGIERVPVECGDAGDLFAYYLPSGRPNLLAPAVICISSEQESGEMLLGRLLPVLVGRGISVLVISHDDVSSQWRGQTNFMLSCCLDYLAAQPNIDASRIGVYGEGLSAVLATDFALCDRRIGAAVCDGGLWQWARTLAAVGWISGNADAMDEEILSARRSRLVRQLRCPTLVVAGGRGAVSESEAVRLQVDCEMARIDLELAIPRIALTPLGEIENFVASDDCIFGWLEHKLTRSSAPSLFAPEEPVRF